MDVRIVGQKEFLVSKKRCIDLHLLLGDLKFTIQNTQVTIKPEGYLYSFESQDNECLVGIQSIPDEQNEIRLGQVFLQHFFVGLDFEKGTI